MQAILAQSALAGWKSGNQTNFHEFSALPIRIFDVRNSADVGFKCRFIYSGYRVYGTAGCRASGSLGTEALRAKAVFTLDAISSTEPGPTTVMVPAMRLI